MDKISEEKKMVKNTNTNITTNVHAHAKVHAKESENHKLNGAGMGDDK